MLRPKVSNRPPSGKSAVVDILIEQLFQFSNNCLSVTLDKKFCVRVIAGTKFNLGKPEFTDYLFAVGSSGLQGPIRLVNHQCIFVMEVHGCGLARVPDIIPNDNFVILQQLRCVLSGKRKGVAAVIRDWLKRMVLKFDYDGADTRLTGNVALMTKNCRALLGKRYHYKIMLRWRQRTRRIPNSDAFVI